VTATASTSTPGSIGWITSLRAALSEELPAAVALRRALHAEPELSGHEQRTAARVAAALGQPAPPTSAAAASSRSVTGTAR
jgi:metal-dependent amidase/aminoacylase/carboxypeptidase family protein